MSLPLVLHYVYEQDIRFPGWPDDGGGGMTACSWYDHDLAGDVIPLYVLEPGFFMAGDDIFYQLPPLTTEVHPQLFIDQDVFYIPMSVRALRQPVQMLRNEVRRVR